MTTTGGRCPICDAVVMDLQHHVNVHLEEQERAAREEKRAKKKPKQKQSKISLMLPGDKKAGKKRKGELRQTKLKF